MKNQLFLFLSIFLLVGQLQAQTQIPSYVPTNGLVGWWPFNGNANDESGNGNNGTVNGATLTTDRFGNVGKAYSFNGTNNYVNVSNSSIAAFGVQSFTCMAWFNSGSTASANNSGMFVRYDNCVTNSGWGLGFSGYKVIGLEFPASRVSNTVISSNTYNNSQWHLAMFVRNVSIMKDQLYINGVLITETSFSTANQLSNTGSVLRFGSCAGYQYFSGNLDDIGIWNRALTQQEITELYTSSDPFDISATTSTVCAGQPTTLSVQSVSGTITALNCASATNTGTLTAGIAANGVSSSVPYTGGNGGPHNGQTVSSTGVTGLTATLTAGTFVSGNGSLTYTITGTPSTSGTASFALNIGGQTCTLTRTVVAGTISALTCTSASNNGTLTAGVAASGVSSIIPYTGGNGGLHNGQTVTSTGITGLTATLTAGSFANGAGSLSYIITGTPSTSGTANFALNIGGQTCTLTRSVATLVSQYPTGSVFCTANPTAIVNVTNPTTGRTWMDRNLGATQVATSSTDANAYGDLYQWGRKSDGHQCRTSTTTSTLSSTDTPVNSSFILAPNTPNDWRSPQNDNLWQGLNGVNNPCPSGYRIPNSTELNNEVNSWSTITTLEAFNSVLKLPAAGSRHASLGTLNNVGGNVTLWTSTVQSISSLGLGTGGSSINAANRSRGQSVRCIKEIDGSIGALNCGSSTVTGNLISGSAASGVSVSVPYTGGNGGYYAAQSISSTGVTGLTATISQGLFANGAGNLVFTISGTPSASGTASFLLSIGGNSCTMNLTVNTLQGAYPVGSVFCAAGATVIVDVVNPTTGKTWMDRNLGATQVATSSTDAAAYGDLYQWGRRSDGHQCRNSATTSTLSSTDQPSHGSFIVTNGSPNDWRSPQNNTRWQGVNGVNNPCPSGYRIPTVAEFDAERLSWSSNNAAGAIASPLKLPMAGRRVYNTGSIDPGSPSGFYWTSGVSLPYCQDLVFSATSALPASNLQWISFGDAVRCIKN